MHSQPKLLAGFAELGRDNYLWAPFCKKWIIDRQHAILLARRRRVELFEAEIANEAYDAELRRLKEKDEETEDDDGGWVLMPSSTSKFSADRLALYNSDKLGRRRTPWWEPFTANEEAKEAKRDPGEKPLWKEAFVAWKIARDHNMLKV